MIASTDALALADKSERPTLPPGLTAWVSANLTDACFGLALPVLWALGHTYAGIEGDARIYMGRALADLDPGGVGRDMMFALDGQSSFSLFRLMAHGLASTIGFGPTVAFLALVSSITWFAAAIVLVRAVVPGRAAALVLAVVCVLPRLYAPWNLLAAGEGMPVPRPLAEAGVMLALAALCHGRYLLCTASLFVAALFHPIMAAPGFGILLLVLGLRDRRWFAAAAAGAIGVVGAGALGLPVASRLMATLDPAWRDLLLDRNPYLFLHRWPMDMIGFIPVQWGTIVIGSLWLSPRARLIFLGSIGVAIVGCAASLLLGDVAADLLFVQAQLWRALWMPAVLAPIAAGICLVHLPRRGPTGQIALAALCLAWIAADMVPLAPIAALAAMAACFGGPRLSFEIGRSSVIAAWAVCMALAAVSDAGSIAALRSIAADMPPTVHAIWDKAWLLRLPIIPVALFGYAVWRWPQSTATRIGVPIVVLAGVLVQIVVCDTRTPAHADADAATLKPDLVALLRGRPGEVLWLDGDDGWYWARRPNWNGPTHGGGIVFSRDLAMTWQARADAMIEAGLGTSWLMHPWRDQVPFAALPLDPEKITAFCKRSDAPAWIVGALDLGTQPPARLGASVWVPRRPHLKLYVGAQEVHWRRFDRYAVIPCRLPQTGT